MVLILSRGYIAQAFARELKRRQISYTCLARSKFDYTKFENLYLFLREHRPKFVINCAGVTGEGNIDWCEDHKSQTLLWNLVLPVTVGNACASHGIAWAH